MSNGAQKGTDPLRFGVLGRPHGVRGEIILRPYNAGGFALDEVEVPFSVDLEKGGSIVSRSLVAVRAAANDFLVRFEGIGDRDAAAALTNAVVLLPRDQLPELDPGEFYVEDLVGCEVFDQAGRRRGVVRGTFWNGAQDVLTIVDADGAEWMVPAVDDFLQEIDLEGRRIVVDAHE